MLCLEQVNTRKWKWMKEIYKIKQKEVYVHKFYKLTEIAQLR